MGRQVRRYRGASSDVGRLEHDSECVGGLHNIVTDGSTSWGWAFNWGNGDAWELDWKRPAAGGNAARLVDDVDLVAFSGHGSGNNFQFAAEKNDWSAVPSEMDLGLRDCEWLLTYTCNFLKGTPSTYGVAANGAHLICGYCTDMTVTSNGGSKFASYATTPYGVRVAWYKYGLTTQSGGWSNTARTFGAISAKNDYLWGYGSVAADPPSYGSKPEAYAYWDTKLNW